MREVTWACVSEVFDVLERHGINRGDHEDVGRASDLVAELASVYHGEAKES